MIDEALGILHATGAIAACAGEVARLGRAIQAAPLSHAIPGLVERVLAPVSHVIAGWA